jgi:hypothetical protein
VKISRLWRRTFALVVFASNAFCQQTATTDDGKVVTLFSDGTWKAAARAATNQLTGTLEIQAGIVFQSGPRPVARETFYLINTSLADLVSAYVDKNPKYKPLTMETFAVALSWLGTSDQSPYASKERAASGEILQQMQKHVVKTITTDFAGKATFEAVPVGNYNVAGFQVMRGKGGIVWDVPVEIKAGANSLILDQHNASGIHGY